MVNMISQRSNRLRVPPIFEAHISIYTNYLNFPVHSDRIFFLGLLEDVRFLCLELICMQDIPSSTTAQQVYLFYCLFCQNPNKLEQASSLQRN